MVFTYKGDVMEKRLCLLILVLLGTAPVILSCSGTPQPAVSVSPHSPLLEPDQVLKSRISRLYTGLTQEQTLDVLSRKPDRIKGESWFFDLRHPAPAENVPDHIHAGYVIDFRNGKIVNIEPFYRKNR